jgi:heme O synthase-like polyprenyltransferase
MNQLPHTNPSSRMLRLKTLKGGVMGAVTGFTGSLVAIVAVEIAIPVVFIVGTATIVGSALGLNMGIDKLNKNKSQNDPVETDRDKINKLRV